MDLTTRFASGILDKTKALNLAQGFADLYEEDYTVLGYNNGEFDVEPSKPEDCPLVTPFVIARLTPAPS